MASYNKPTVKEFPIFGKCISHDFVDINSDNPLLKKHTFKNGYSCLVCEQPFIEKMYDELEEKDTIMGVPRNSEKGVEFVIQRNNSNTRFAIGYIKF